MPRDNSTPDDAIPYGYCHCGCGQKTNLAVKNSARFGHVKGEPMQYILGHRHKRYDVVPPNPSGLCMCGCGQRTTIAKMTYAKEGRLAGHYNKYIPGHERRLSRPYTIDPDTGCWNWNGGTDEKGYALTTVDGQTRRVHIVKYEETHGPTPDGMELDHLCRNRRCINPDHVEPVTHAENCRRGANAKLTWDDVRYIRASRGTISAIQLAQQFNVRKTAIYAVWNKATWWPDEDQAAACSTVNTDSAPHSGCEHRCI